jgi:hypothetical protein
MDHRRRSEAEMTRNRSKTVRIIEIADLLGVSKQRAHAGVDHLRRAFAELLIDCEEDRTLRAVLVGMLREADRGR